MASSVKFVLNRGGFRDLLNRGDVQEELLGRAEAVKSSADAIGSGRYVADVQAGSTRARAMVKTTDIVSRRSNAKHNSLLKSLGAGG